VLRKPPEIRGRAPTTTRSAHPPRRCASPPQEPSFPRGSVARVMRLRQNWRQLAGGATRIGTPTHLQKWRGARPSDYAAECMSPNSARVDVVLRERPQLSRTRPLARFTTAAPSKAARATLSQTQSPVSERDAPARADPRSQVDSHARRVAQPWRSRRDACGHAQRSGLAIEQTCCAGDPISKSVGVQDLTRTVRARAVGGTRERARRSGGGPPQRLRPRGFPQVAAIEQRCDRNRDRQTC
jgi:hypothetical protein